MISIFLVFGLFAVFFLWGFLSDWGDCESLPAVMTCIMVLIIFCTLSGLVISHSDGTFPMSHELLRLKIAHAQQLERDGFSYDYESLMQEVMGSNAKLYKIKLKLQNPWTNWFYPTNRADIEPIEIR